MRITEIKISLESSEDEKKTGRPNLTLIRGIDKIWKVKYEERIEIPLTDVQTGFSNVLIKERGLLPYEIRLANDIQELIIQKFNGGIK